KVDVVRHQAVREALPAPLADDITEQLQIPLTIRVVHKNHASIDTTCVDVVNSAGLFTSRFPWHVQRSRASEKLAPASRGQTPFTDVTFTCEGGLTPTCYRKGLRRPGRPRRPGIAIAAFSSRSRSAGFRSSAAWLSA